MKLYPALLLVFIISSVFSPVSSAAVVAPDLSKVLQSADAGSEVAVIIRLSDRADLRQAVSAVANPDGADSSPAINSATNNRIARRDAIIRALKEKAALTQLPLKAFLQKKGARKIAPLWITNAIGATIPVSLIQELLAVPGVESIELDNVIQAPAVAPTSMAATAWNISRIKAPSLWNAGITGEGIVVANLDTGVDVTHPDLHPKWRGGGCAAPPYCESWFDPHANSTQPYDRAGISTGHGTGSMGIMVGSSADDSYGVAPGARWIAAKIFDDARNAPVSVIHKAFQWVLCPGCDPAATGCVCAPPPDVVNNSWGGSTNGSPCDLTFQPDVQALTAAGIAVVFAAGNSGPGAGTGVSPANLPGSFAVGATDYFDTIASFSSRGPSACDGSIFPHVVAPGVSTGGVGIFTAAPAGQYQTLVGTSFAAPHVSGAAALLAGIFPGITPDQMVAVLEQTALHLLSAAPDDTVPNNIYGYGLIDVEAAYKSSFISARGDVPFLAAVPSSFVFSDTVTGFSSASESFLIANQGTADLTITASPNGVLMGGSNPGDFIVTADSCSGVTLPSLGSCSVSVFFRPGSVGSKSALLQVGANDQDTLFVTIPLEGSGVSAFTAALVRDGVTLRLYASIRTAYEDCADGDIIKLRNTTITESPDFNLQPGTVFSLQGGYDAAFGSQSGYTTIQGMLTISSGTVTVGNVIVQ